MRSPIYWHRLAYTNTYGRSHPDFEGRYRVVADLIPPGVKVLDLCCGDADMYTHYLRNKVKRYTGIDLSLSMAPHWVRPQLIRGNVRDIELPIADYVVMIEALYHFDRSAEDVLRRMRCAAREKVIVIEQVQNKITRLPEWLNRFISNPGDGSGWFRFNRETLEKILKRVDPRPEKQLLFDGYDLLIIMKGLAVTS